MFEQRPKGGPAPGRGKTRGFTFDVTQAELDELRRVADVRGLSMKNVIREALRRSLADVEAEATNGARS
jgi:hypothetical protein